VLFCSSWHCAVVLLRLASFCSGLRRFAPVCIVLLQFVSFCSGSHCFAPVCVILLRFASFCSGSRHFAPVCIVLLRIAVELFLLPLFLCCCHCFWHCSRIVFADPAIFSDYVTIVGAVGAVAGTGGSVVLVGAGGGAAIDIVDDNIIKSLLIK